MRLDDQDGVSLTTETSESNPSASLSQDWLDVADAEERVMRNLPRVVASLPSIRREDEPKGKSSRLAKIAWLRVASSYTATFLLGGVCVAFGARCFDSKVESVDAELTETQFEASNENGSDFSLNALAFEQPQETSRVEVPLVGSNVSSNESPLRFNAAYGSYADAPTSEPNAFAPQTDLPQENADVFPQVAREEEVFPTWADLESNENAFPTSDSALTNDDRSFAASASVPTAYETARASEPFQQNYAQHPVAPAQTAYNANYAQAQNSNLQLNAPSAPQYVSNDVRSDYNQSNGYASINSNNNSVGYNQKPSYTSNAAINSSANERAYATNAGNTNYNNEGSLDDFTASNATDEDFGSYSMNASVPSEYPVFEEGQNDVYGTQTASPSVDRSFIPTFNAPNPTQNQGAPSSARAAYVAQNREEAQSSAPVVSSDRPLRW